MQESSNECISKWNDKSVSLPQVNNKKDRLHEARQQGGQKSKDQAYMIHKLFFQPTGFFKTQLYCPWSPWCGDYELELWNLLGLGLVVVPKPCLNYFPSQSLRSLIWTMRQEEVHPRLFSAPWRPCVCRVQHHACHTVKSPQVAVFL